MSDLLVVNGIDRKASAEETRRAARQVFEEASNGCAWLRPGDRVLLKVSLNSPDPYPATTSPIAVRAVVEALRDRGARVVVGDMPGLEYVLLAPKQSRGLSSRECFERSGMGAGSDVEFVGFEERGWDEGFRLYRPEGATSWPDGFHATRLIEEVDHIVALPRLSTHTQGGVTLAFKIAVGYLRADSRIAFHRDGPFYGSMKTFVRDADIPTELPNHHRFFEKITEINLAAASRQRVTLCVGTEGQVTFGPDRKIPIYGFKSHRVVPDVGLVFASANPVAVEVLGIAFLTLLYRQAPWYKRLIQKLLMVFNGQARELGRDPVWANPFVRHAIAVGLGTADFELRTTAVPRPLLDALAPLLAKGEA